jgi:hypothetical protein
LKSFGRHEGPASYRRPRNQILSAARILVGLAYTLLELKYHTIDDAADRLGGVPAIRDTFIGFQRYLYEAPRRDVLQAVFEL